MRNNKYLSKIAAVGFCFLIFALAIAAQSRIPAPKDVLGFVPGDDRKLASWKQTIDYFRQLDAASDRVKFEEIGVTTMNAPFVYATISAPENLKNLAKYKEIQRKLADPRTIKSNDKTAQDLIKQGKTIVLITCGVHSNEVGSYLSSMLIAEKLATANDAETLKILDNTIILLVPSLNPDGVDIIKNWYDKTLGTPYEGTEPPELYHKYVGHDDNRDWYAFTQVETQLTVDKIHNEWHPQIVHDIHQQGAYGARLFVPPYLKPVEPNVPPEIVEGYTELGSYIAKDLRGKGFAGITTDSTYDAWTPARAYSHYHGGVRILSETASAKLATPITVKYEDLRNGLGYDVRKDAPNFAPVWKGGEWHLRDITNYMTTAAFSLLKHAADNREKWLARFYAIGKEAVRPRKLEGNFDETSVWIIDTKNFQNAPVFLEALERAGVEIKYVKKFTFNRVEYDDYTPVIFTNQPYIGFAEAMFKAQSYPDLRDENGLPIPPYDVTGHNLALLTGIKRITNAVSRNVPKLIEISPKRIDDANKKVSFDLEVSNFLLYKSYVPSMDEGWTRWVFDEYKNKISSLSNQKPLYESVTNKQIQKLQFSDNNKTIIFPDQSPNQILNGYAKGTMPDEYTGGVGKDGVQNLRKFVEAGGTLVFLNRASRFAIREFDLPVRDVTENLPRKEFYIPGSILRTTLDVTHPIAKGMPKDSIAWFEDSPAFEIKTDPLALTKNFKIIASYPKNANEILLSGYALGAEKIAGKAALVEFTIGKGKIVLFGFRPQYRGQSLATFPLLFNAISN